MVIVLPSVVSSTGDSGSILSRSRMGLSMMSAQLLPCLTRFLITRSSSGACGRPLYPHCTTCVCWWQQESARLAEWPGLPRVTCVPRAPEVPLSSDSRRNASSGFAASVGSKASQPRPPRLCSREDSAPSSPTPAQTLLTERHPRFVTGLKPDVIPGFPFRRDGGPPPGECTLTAVIVSHSVSSGALKVYSESPATTPLPRGGPPVWPPMLPPSESPR